MVSTNIWYLNVAADAHYVARCSTSCCMSLSGRNQECEYVLLSSSKGEVYPRPEVNDDASDDATIIAIGTGFTAPLFGTCSIPCHECANSFSDRSHTEQCNWLFACSQTARLKLLCARWWRGGVSAGRSMLRDPSFGRAPGIQLAHQEPSTGLTHHQKPVRGGTSCGRRGRAARVRHRLSQSGASCHQRQHTVRLSHLPLRPHLRITRELLAINDNTQDVCHNSPSDLTSAPHESFLPSTTTHSTFGTTPRQTSPEHHTRASCHQRQHTVRLSHPPVRPHLSITRELLAINDNTQFGRHGVLPLGDL
jgi:hypothetical protein